MTKTTLTPLRQIHHPKGDVYHALKATEASFIGFGEAYFTTILHSEVKGWKRHRQMTMNLVVPCGRVRFFLRAPQENNLETHEIGEGNYARLTVPPGYWVAFEGLGEGLNLVLNIASLPHDPGEADNVAIETYSTIK